MAVNGIVTRELWWPAPWWQTALITFIIGLLVTLAVAWFELKKAIASTLGLMVVYFVINGIVLFDWGNRVYGIAGPLIVAPLVCFILTAVRYISEQTQKRKITQRFQSYVDPKLVSFVLENIDDKTVFEGQVRLMTVVFTDLAGFTSISEKLRERTVGLLNDYMSLMLPIIRENNGYWNKFLGDGIMFFFGAPAVSPTHARDAAITVLEMQKALIPFNEQLAKDELPPVAMRAGISTGPMIVGDAGSKHFVHTAADYTVLGDEVNLGARLETANKYLGSQMLMNDLAAQLCGEEFLLRPMGNICVAGKSEGVQCFEPLCKVSEATEAQKRLAALSQQVVESFGLSQFDLCLKAAETMEAEFGSSKFTDLYQSLARLYMVEPPGEKFDGQIVLAEK
jgi:adenylate cyclase